jgi:hypothetical protein
LGVKGKQLVRSLLDNSFVDNVVLPLSYFVNYDQTAKFIPTNIKSTLYGEVFEVWEHTAPSGDVVR